MKKYYLMATILLPLLLAFPLKGQDTLMPADTLSGWELDWIAALNGSQASYSNWSKGGVNNFSAVASSQFSAFYRQDRISYGLRIVTRYGQSRLQDEGVRKIDDRISIRNRFLREVGPEDLDFNFFLNINFETQFGRGFDYGAAADGGDLLISKFFSPAYMMQNAGLAYVPNDYISVETGLGLKQTFVSDTTLSTRYGLGEGETFFNEAGLTFGVNYNQPIMENLTYSGYLETFTNLNRPLRRTDIIFSNQIIGRINDYLNLSLQFEMIYDDDFSSELQVSQVLSAGLSVTIM